MQKEQLIRFTRKACAIPALLGLIACLILYGATLSRTFLSTLSANPFIWLIVPAFIFLVPMFLIEGKSLKRKTFFWKDFAKHMPNWVVPAIKIVGLIAIAHFLLFLILTHANSPEIKNGVYVLESHGETVKILSERQYFHLRGWGVRMFGIYGIFMYLVSVLYWWFPRNVCRSELS